MYYINSIEREMKMNLQEQITELLNQGVPWYEIVIAFGAVGGIIALLVIIFVLHWQTM